MSEKETPWSREHLDVVEGGAKRVEKWREANPGKEFHLQSADLRNIHLLGADLRRTNFDNAILAGATLREANLEGANLQCANLRGADLRDANLQRSDLRRANLRGSDLRGADLRDADLRRASILTADLRCATLSCADLELAEIELAQFDGASLEGADLARARLLDCEWGGANLTQARMGGTLVASDMTDAANLDVVHVTYSRIAHDSLLRPTRRAWPIKFLRGVGLSDTEIEFVRSMSSNALEFYSAFISYSAKGDDDRFAVKIHDALQATGVRCWLDKHEVDPGDDVLERINEGVRLWDKVLLLCSKQSLKSHWVRREVERAFQKEKELEDRHGKRILCIIPIDLDGYLFSRHCKFKFASDLRERHAAKFDGWRDDESVFDAQLQRVVKALRSDDGVRPPPPTPKLS